MSSVAPPQTRARDTPVDWYTPPSVFAALGLRFDLDPCAPPLPAADWIPASRRISLPDDGLAEPWQFECDYCYGQGRDVLLDDQFSTSGAPCPECGTSGYEPGRTPRVWLNPPYGDQCAKWVGKLADHGRGIALVFSRTDTAWWQAAARRATAVTFIDQRLSFVPGHRSDRSCKSPNASAPSCLLAFGGAEAQACADSGLGLTLDCREPLSTPPQGAML